MKIKFEKLFEQIMGLFEMDSASALGGSAHTGDYEISYAPNDARNIVGTSSINAIRDPNKKRKGKKSKKRKTGVIMPVQRRMFPSVNENLVIRDYYDVMVQQTERSSPMVVYRNVLAKSEQDAIIQFLKYKNKKYGIKTKALPTYQYFKIWAEKKEPINARLPYPDS